MQFESVNTSEDQNAETTDNDTENPFEIFESSFAKASEMDGTGREAFLKNVADDHEQCFDEILSLYLMWAEVIKRTGCHTSGSANGRAC